MATIEKRITIPQERSLELLRDSVIHSLEGGQKASKFPTLHAYIEMTGEDVPNATVRKLREEFIQIRDSLPSINFGIVENGQFVAVDKISGRGYASNPDAGFFLTAVGLPTEFPVKDKLAELINWSIETCDKAIGRNCGFGKYSETE
jgi:hypothetical protein